MRGSRGANITDVHSWKRSRENEVTWEVRKRNGFAGTSLEGLEVRASHIWGLGRKLSYGKRRWSDAS